MHLFVGTGGYSYKEWKGSFYPDKLPANEMLNYYAQHFSTVEINNTFYKMPDASTFEPWLPQVSTGFQFVIKAPQLITHRKRLKNAEAELDQLLKAVAALQDHRGPLLFQLPPNLKKDVALLETFLQGIGQRAQTAFEFRHDSWNDVEVSACLRSHGCALYVADTDEVPRTELISTAAWGYVRLRRESYTDKELKGWVKRIKAQPWKSAYVFFKYEETGTSPQFAARFLELASD